MVSVNLNSESFLDLFEDIPQEEEGRLEFDEEGDIEDFSDELPSRDPATYVEAM